MTWRLSFSERFSDNLYTGEAARAAYFRRHQTLIWRPCRQAMPQTSSPSAGQEMLPPGVRMPLPSYPKLKLLYNPQMKSAYNFVPGVMGLILMLICAMMTSISIVREKETGTMEVSAGFSRQSRCFIILAKGGAVLCAVVCQLDHHSSAFGLCASMFRWRAACSGWWRCRCFSSFVSLALGLLISTVTRTQVAAMLVSGLDADDAHYVAFGNDIPY